METLLWTVCWQTWIFGTKYLADLYTASFNLSFVLYNHLKTVAILTFGVQKWYKNAFYYMIRFILRPQCNKLHCLWPSKIKFLCFPSGATLGIHDQRFHSLSKIHEILNPRPAEPGSQGPKVFQNQDEDGFSNPIVP